MNATEIIVLIFGILVGAINVSMIWSLFAFWKDVDKKIEKHRKAQEEKNKEIENKLDKLTKDTLDVFKVQKEDIERLWNLELKQQEVNEALSKVVIELKNKQN